MKSIIVLACLLLAAIMVPGSLHSQENLADSTRSFGANRSVGFAVSSLHLRDILDIPELSIIVPLSDRIEMHAALVYGDDHVLTQALEYGTGPFGISFPNSSTIGILAKLLYSTSAKNRISARYGMFGGTTFAVWNSKDPIETISRASLSSGSLSIGLIGGVEYSFSSRLRLSAYFVPHYNRTVRPGYSDELWIGDIPYNRRISGFYMPLILEIAVKPF